MSLTEPIQPQPPRWAGFLWGRSPFSPYALVGPLFGVLLLAAAGLKAYGLGLESVSPEGIFSSRWFQVGVTVFEVFLLCGSYGASNLSVHGLFRFSW